MANRLTEILFPATSEIHKRIKAGEFAEDIKEYAQDCAGCRRFATGIKYIQPVIFDLAVIGTAGTAAYGFYQLSSIFFK